MTTIHNLTDSALPVAIHTGRIRFDAPSGVQCKCDVTMMYFDKISNWPTVKVRHCDVILDQVTLCRKKTNGVTKYI